MPIYTYIAGSPGSITTLADDLSDHFVVAVDDLETCLLRRRTAIRDHWESDAGEAAYASVGDLRECAEALGTSAGDIATALRAYAGELRTAKGLMQDARDVARGGGLTVTERLIEGPPVAPDPSWETGLVELAPAQEAPFEEFQTKINAWNDAVEKSDDAISGLAEACDRLVEDLGKASEVLELLTDMLGDLPAGAVNAAGETLSALQRRMEQAAARSGYLATLSPEQSRLLYSQLFNQAQHLEDAGLLRQAAGVTGKAGKGVDILMLAQKAMERHEEGEGWQQIALAEGGGWAAGALTTAGVWAAGGSAAGAIAGPPGMIALGGLAAVAGVAVGTLTTNQVDDWYEDKEFEDMLRDSMREGDRRR